MQSRYRRILLKLSGEALAGKKGYGIDPSVADYVATQIHEVHDMGVQIGLVLGGGNIFRGLAGSAAGIDRTVGDTVGMLATLINSLLLKETLQRHGVRTSVLSAVQIDKAADLFTTHRAVSLLLEGQVVIVAGGTGNPFFTTDTAAALRCAELACDVLIKATKVDGIYEADPVKNPDSKKIPRLTHQEALARNLRIMDSTAFSLCMDNDITIVVLELMRAGNLRKCVEGASIGSIVTKGA
jgi:uridylate kinase